MPMNKVLLTGRRIQLITTVLRMGATVNIEPKKKERCNKRICENSILFLIDNDGVYNIV